MGLIRRVVENGQIGNGEVIIGFLPYRIKRDLRIGRITATGSIGRTCGGTVRTPTEKIKSVSGGNHIG